MNIIKLLTLSLVILLSGCMGAQASFSERMQDNFLFTSAENVSASEKRCITLTKPFTLESGSVTYSIPAGRYIAEKKNKTGYFYYAPKRITSSNWLLSPSQQGIYLNNQLNKGNLFGRESQGYANRPIRGAVLPKAIFSYIQKNSKC